MTVFRYGPNAQQVETDALSGVSHTFNERMGLKEGVYTAIDLAVGLSPSINNPIVICVAGGSASGKTSQVADRIAENFGADGRILSMDNYYRGAAFIAQMNSAGAEMHWDDPRAVDTQLVAEHLERLKRGKPINMPVYDFASSSRVGTEKFEPAPVIVVEGIFALDQLMREHSDINVFVDIGMHGRFLRRLLRDLAERGESDPQEIIKYFGNVVEVAHQEHVQPQIAAADLIIDNEYDAHIEAERTGVSEQQIKYPVQIDVALRQRIAAAGGRRISWGKQRDQYYFAHDRNFHETGEMLKIRNEDGHASLIYKGPSSDGTAQERMKFDFDLDSGTEFTVSKLYDRGDFCIEKTREAYQVGSFVLVLDDDVTRVDGAGRHLLGDYLTVWIPARIPPVPGTYPPDILSVSSFVENIELKALLIHLGLGDVDPEKRNYSKMPVQ